MQNCAKTTRGDYTLAFDMSDFISMDLLVSMAACHEANIKWQQPLKHTIFKIRPHACLLQCSVETQADVIIIMYCLGNPSME